MYMQQQRVFEACLGFKGFKAKVQIELFEFAAGIFEIPDEDQEVSATCAHQQGYTCRVSAGPFVRTAQIWYASQ